MCPFFHAQSSIPKIRTEVGGAQATVRRAREVPGGTDLQAEFGGQPGTDLSTGRQAESKQGITEAIRETCVGLDQFRQAFGKNLLRAG